MIRILLEAGANPNLQIKLQPTYRSLKDDRGADTMLVDGATPLLRAAKGHDVAAIELLLKHGAHIDLPNRDGTTPLMAAAGVQANAIDTRGDYTTSLVGLNSKYTIEALLKGGADINKIDQIGARRCMVQPAGAGTRPLKCWLQTVLTLMPKMLVGLTPLDYATGKRTAGRGRGVTGAYLEETVALIEGLTAAP